MKESDLKKAGMKKLKLPKNWGEISYRIKGVKSEQEIRKEAIKECIEEANKLKDWYKKELGDQAVSGFNEGWNQTLDILITRLKSKIK